MGLLDDAIREHLDLKRRRGADPTEVARLEQEALGPVRRERVPAEAEPTPAREPEEAQPELGGAAAEHQPEPQHEPESQHEPEHQPADEPQPEAADRAGGAGEDDSATPLAESPRPATGPARSDAGPEDEPQDEAREQDPRHSDIVHQPTTEFRVEDHHDDADEDVLEETPDFLQETPEHDRLWFEQRPPRDFDFDG